MSIKDVANARWLTYVEVLQYLDRACGLLSVKEGGAGIKAGNNTGEGTVPVQQSQLLPTIQTAPPSIPSTSGTLLLYRSTETPDYAQDGIEWIVKKGGSKWKTIEGVLAGGDNIFESSDSSSKVTVGVGGGINGDGVNEYTMDAITEKREWGGSGSHSGGGSSSKSTSAMQVGAKAEYLTSVAKPTFHRREYRGLNDMVLVH